MLNDKETTANNDLKIGDLELNKTVILYFYFSPYNGLVIKSTISLRRNVNYYYKMTTSKQIFILIITILTLQSCSNSNDKIYSKFMGDIKDSIKINNAEEFDYTDFVLHSQKSYFVGSKIKVLKLKSSGELCDSETYYLFNSKSDSILFIISRTECYENPDRWKNQTDTIYVTNFKNKTEESYANGEIVKRTKINNNYLYQDDIMYDIKTHTEKKYNSR